MGHQNGLPIQASLHEDAERLHLLGVTDIGVEQCDDLVHPNHLNLDIPFREMTERQS